MPNPLGSIIPILDLLGREIKILPATRGELKTCNTLIKKEELKYK
jgi:hypothetical protein